MVDYWKQDTGETLTVTRTALINATRIGDGDYSFFHVVWDVADASKHARLTKTHPAPLMTEAKQVRQYLVGAYNTTPYNAVAYGTLRATDAQAHQTSVSQAMSAKYRLMTFRFGKAVT